MNRLMKRRITDEEIKGATVPGDTLLVVTEKGGACRELTFSSLMNEKGDEFNTTDYMLLCTVLVYFGSYSAGSHFGWSAKVSTGDFDDSRPPGLQPDSRPGQPYSC